MSRKSPEAKSAKSAKGVKNGTAAKAAETVKSKSEIKKKCPEKPGKTTSKHKSNSNIKTPQVMRLVENKKRTNGVILAGKSRIPRSLSGREPLSRILKREMSAQFGEEWDDLEDTVVVNITQLAIEYAAADILDRFNACSCDKCVEAFSRIIAERVPVRFARISKASVRQGSPELTERMAPVRKIVLSEMIKELIGNKKRCFHDK